MHLIDKIVSDPVLDAAFRWVCERRQEYSHNSDIWELRRNWTAVKPALRKALLTGHCGFSLLREIRTNTEILEVWCARDALALKALSLVLTEHLNPVISDQCHHVKGKGGAIRAIHAARNALSPNAFVMKSDIREYYAFIDHRVLLCLAEKYIADRFVLRLIRHYLRRTVCFGGNYRDVTQGISLGCPLSPLMGALYLKPLDDAVVKTGLFYARFMDDWLIIAPNRWRLKKTVCMVNRILNELKVEQHPDKTFIGRASKGFDFLGYHISPGDMVVAAGTIGHHIERIDRLYEQGATVHRIRQYIRRWWLWVASHFRGLRPLHGIVVPGLSMIYECLWCLPISCAVQYSPRGASRPR
jgi:RNA-directed DNA polymerase